MHAAPEDGGNAEDGSGAGIVGSSNLTAPALVGGVEWNYRVVTSRDRESYHFLRSQFDALFLHENTVPLSHTWIEGYVKRRKSPDRTVEGVTPEAPDPVPTPTPIQEEALQAKEYSACMTMCAVPAKQTPAPSPVILLLPPREL